MKNILINKTEYEIIVKKSPKCNFQFDIFLTNKISNKSYVSEKAMSINPFQSYRPSEEQLLDDNFKYIEKYAQDDPEHYIEKYYKEF